MDNRSVPVQGCLVISLDYELLWGGIEKRFPEDYGQSNVKNVPEVLDRLVGLFERYGAHATVAIVGLIMEENAAHAWANAPKTRPSYKKDILSPYNNGSRYELRLQYFSTTEAYVHNLERNIETRSLS